MKKLNSYQYSNIVFIALLSVTILVGCKANKDVFEEDPEVDNRVEEIFQEDELADEPPVRERYNPSETRVNDVVHSKLEVSFDWEKAYLNGIATLTITPHFYPVNDVVLDAKGMNIQSVEIIINKEKEALQFDYDNMFITAKLNKQYTRKDTFNIVVKYTAKPNEWETNGSSAIASDKGLYFINNDKSDPNKMPQIWTQGETEASSVWFPTIDAPNERHTQELFITVDKKYKTLSNGKLVYSNDNGNGTRTDYWKQELSHAPYLTMMAIGEFSVVKDEWTRADGSKMVVDYYVEPEWEPYAKSIFGDTPEMIEYFSNLLGVEYPWDKYSQIVVRDYVSGAMENTSAVIHGDFLYQTDRELLDGTNESIIAHELFHHWFGDLVTCESWANLPLNESFANYSQFLWDEYKHGNDEADYQAEKEAAGYFGQSQQSGAVDMIRFDYEDKEDMFDAHSYNKGGRILHMLRNVVGDTAFFRSLEFYLKENAYQPVEIHNLRLAFEEVTGKDLNWFFNQWFLDKGHPALRIEQVKDTLNDQIIVNIAQTQDFNEVPLYKLPFAVEIYFKNGKKRREEVVMESVNMQLKYGGIDDIACIIVDADRVLLAEFDEEKPLEQYLYQYEHAPHYKDRKEAIMKAGKSSKAEAVDVILKAYSDPFYALRIKAISNSRYALKQKKNEVIEKLFNIAKNDPVSNVRAKAIKVLVDELGKDEKVVTILENALLDSSYLVNSEALTALYVIKPEKAIEKAKSLEDSRSSDVLVAVASIYAENPKEEYNSFFQNALNSMNGFSKMGMISSYSTYLEDMPIEMVKKSIFVFEDMAKTGGAWYFKMFGYQGLMNLEAKYAQKEQQLKNKLDSMQAEGASESDINQTENERMKMENMNQYVYERIVELKKQEKSQNLLNMLQVYE